MAAAAALQLRLLHSHSQALPLSHEKKNGGEVSAVLHIWVSGEAVLSAAGCQLIQKVPRVHVCHMCYCVRSRHRYEKKNSDIISIGSDGSVHGERRARNTGMFWSRSVRVFTHRFLCECKLF